MRVLVTGVGGQLGWELVRSLHAFADVIPASRNLLDLARPDTINGVVRELRPDLIINAAAHTAVDRAETERELAFRINADAVGELGRVAHAIGVPVIHFSTDYVFNGHAERPWRESDATGPLSVYGASKLAGEQALAASGATHWIFRTSWVYSARGRNFVKAILARAATQNELRVVADQRGTPTWARSLADIVTSLLQPGLRDAHALARRIDETAGLYHLTSAGETTWHGFAEFIAAALARRSVRVVPVQPVGTADFPTAATRPAYSVLDCGRFRASFDLDLPDWRVGAALCLDELLASPD